MKKSYFIIVVSIVCLMFQSLTLWGQTEMGMYLGDLAFVKAKPSIAMELRTLNMKMSTTGINYDFYSKVGGVSFVQTAIPEFEVNTITCDVVDSISYVIVNGKSYAIPLENWMLKPIVAYANSDKNAAITLYGGDEIPIKYHPAFIDNLLGLRLLQTDMLMSGMFSRVDMAKIPTFDKKREIITQKEAKSIGGRKLISVLEYEKQSELAFNEIDNYFESINDKPNTYVYTDYGETISFSANDSLGIQFHGAPYYRFAQIGPDTLEAVKLISSFVDSMELRKELYYSKNGDKFFNNDYYSNLLYLKKQIKSKKKLKNNLKPFYESIHYSHDRSVTNEFYFTTMAELLTLMQEWGLPVNEELKDPYLTPIIWKQVLNMIQYAARFNPGLNNSVLEDITTINNEDSLMAMTLSWHIWKNAPDTVTELPILTDVFKSKESRNQIHNINPLIIDESEMTCQWSALFRYIKEKNPDGWQDFVRKVSSLSDNLPEDLRMIWTPVNFDNSKSLFDMFM